MKICRYPDILVGEVKYISNMDVLIHNIKISELEEKDKEIERLKNQNQKLLKKSYKDDVIITKTIDELIRLKGSARWERHLYEIDYLIDILKGK